MSDLPLDELLSVAEAERILDAAPVTPRIVSLPLARAQGHFLAEDLTADRDYPPFDKSLMDGYAVHSADVARGPTALLCIGEIAAGQMPHLSVSPGQTVAIMTGAPLPAATDGVVPVEQTCREGDLVRVLASTDVCRYVSRRGSDVPAGTIVLRREARLEAAQLAVAATVGAATVSVFDRPRVAVLATGDELVAIDQVPGPAQIRNCNNLMLTALLERMGCDVTDLGTVPDEPELIRGALERGLTSEALFVTGGMSMGRYDYVPRLLRELSVELKITKLRIKPGKPFVFGVTESSRPRTCVFGLPGNPVSAFVCTVRLATRVLRRMMGAVPDQPRTRAALGEGLPPNGPREFYQPAVLADGVVRSLTWKGSADVFTLASANALLIREPNSPPAEEGTMVDVIEI